VIAVRSGLQRLAGMLAIAAVIWIVLRLAYAAVAGVPMGAVLWPSVTNFVVVLMVCLVAALPRNTP
jgi:hypothetical protein